MQIGSEVFGIHHLQSRVLLWIILLRQELRPFISIILMSHPYVMHLIIHMFNTSVMPYISLDQYLTPKFIFYIKCAKYAFLLLFSILYWIWYTIWMFNKFYYFCCRRGPVRYKFQGLYELDNLAIVNIRDAGPVKNSFKVLMFPDSKIYQADSSKSKVSWPLNWNHLRFILITFLSHLGVIFRPLIKRAYQKINFLISRPKHMLSVLKRTVSMRRFFWALKTYVQTDGLDNIYAQKFCLSKPMYVAVILGAFFSSGVTLLVSDQLLLKGCINFIQSLQKGKALWITDQARYSRYWQTFYWVETLSRLKF